MEQGEERGNVETKQRVVVRKGMDREKAEAELARLSEEKARDLKISKVIQCRVRYFTDACSTGRDYIEVFEQPYPAGNFMFTNRACWVGTATHEFVRMRIEGMTNQQIVDDMNARDLAQTPGQINDFEVR
jgi:hypothetical protein